MIQPLALELQALADDMKRFYWLLACLLGCLLAAPLLSEAQTPAQASDQTQTPGTSKDRLFFTLPNFLTLENASNVPPLTTAEKFKVTARGTFDPVEYFWYGALAGIGQGGQQHIGGWARVRVRGAHQVASWNKRA